MGVEGFEPPKRRGTAFTARPGSPTPAHTLKRKVDGSNVRGVSPGFGLASRPITTLATFQMAEREGFEPPSPFGRQFSRLLPCAGRLSLRSVRTERADRPPLLRQTIESSQPTNGLWGDGPEWSRRGGATRQYDRRPRLKYREQ